MTQAGGPAAINGFLYQILHHLGWMAEVSLSGTLEGALVSDACLILEPCQGGDARAEAAGVYLVEQYKSRKQGTWSVADIVSVLVDLRKGVPWWYPSGACYRFVTDGRPGRLEALCAFLSEIRSAASPSDLDSVTKRRFTPEVLLTDSDFFGYLVTASRAGGGLPADDEQAKVFHLLQHLELEFFSDGGAKADAVEKLLRCYAPDLGDERGIRERLIGVLIEELSKGEVKLDREAIKGIFCNVGLNPERLFRLVQLAETMGERTHHRLARLGYCFKRDVRSPPDWPDTKPVLLIAGTSGTGKTWQLGRLLEALAQSREIATLVMSSANTAESMLQDAARDIWQTGLGETSEKSLIAVSHYLRELTQGAKPQPVTIAFDDIQDVDVARAVIRQDWTEWGMRLVMTVPHDLARALEAVDSERIHLHRVGNFTTDELDRLLRQNDRKWAELPFDLKKLLLVPILAGIFLGLPYRSAQRAPQSEYEIFESFWARIDLKGRPGDEGIVIALAKSYFDEAPYPLPRQRWAEIGLNDESYARLDAAGWLRTIEQGEVAFAHDRLLNWAVGKSLVRQYQRRDLNEESLGDILANSGSKGHARWRRLGYVPMDTLWLLGKDDQSADPLGLIVARMEESREFGSCGHNLYTHLLPTLGQRAVPILCARLNSVISSEAGDYRISWISQAFATLARQDHVDLAQVVTSLLRSTTWDCQSVAIATLTAFPDAAFLDRLWEIHQRRVDALNEKANGVRHEDYQASFAALRAGVATYPQWLRQRILSADPQQEPVCELGYLLNGLDHAEARAIWKEVCDILMAKIPADKPRGLLYCIARFGAQKKMEFVTQNLSQRQDFASGAAFYALSVLNPRAAIDRLMDVGDSERTFTRNQWLPVLLRAEPKLTRQHVLDLAATDSKGRRIIETLFDERPNQINGAMLRFVLRALEQDLGQNLDAAVAGDPIWLYHPLRFLGKIMRPDLLAIIAAEAGGELERMIVKVGCSRLRENRRSLDRVLEGARRFLILIGGEGISTLIRQELDSDHYWVRHGGLAWAFVRRDDGIIERLATIARRPLPRDPNGKLESEAYHEFIQVLCRLAALGADSILVEVLLESGVPEVPIELANLRAHQGPMPVALTERAVLGLANEAATENELLVSLAIAWLSGDADIIPSLRTVLRRADPASRVAAYASIALHELGDGSEEFVRLAFLIAQTNENARWGLNALAGLGDCGRELLLEWLQSSSVASRVDHEGFVIRLLYAHPATRAQAVAAAVASCRRSRHLDDVPYDIAAEASNPALRDQILDKAFAARSFIETNSLCAIKGLAKFDIARAVEAIELALQNHPKIEHQLCRLLVRLVPDTAAEKLIKAAVETERVSLRDAAGRALRRLDLAITGPLLAKRMRGTIPERKIATELAAWTPGLVVADVLAELADHDSSSEVRYAALLALEHHRKEASLKVLLDAFRTADYDKRWCLLTAILDGGDAHLLKEREDPLWLGQILTSDLPAVFEQHANDALRQRMQSDR